MGNVDLADQLRNHYRYDSNWHRNRKWWWAIWWWGFQVLLTNSFITYKKFLELHDRKNTLSHYDYIKQIALAWVSRDLYWPSQHISRKRTAALDERRRTRSRLAVDVDTESKSTSSTKCIQVDEKTLHTVKGRLSCRLNTAIQHFPEIPVAKRPRCQLHRSVTHVDPTGHDNEERCIHESRPFQKQWAQSLNTKNLSSFTAQSTLSHIYVCKSRSQPISQMGGGNGHRFFQSFSFSSPTDATSNKSSLMQRVWSQKRGRNTKISDERRHFSKGLPKHRSTIESHSNPMYFTRPIQPSR